MAVTDQQVRLAIKGYIKTAFPTAQVYAWNVLSHELDEWPGLFRTTDYATSKKTHGWIVKRAAAESEWKNPQRDRNRWIYDIWGFYGFRSGKEADNSDDEFSEIVAGVYAALKAKPTLENPELERHSLLQLIRNTTINCGEETLHFAQCSLRVDLCC